MIGILGIKRIMVVLLLVAVNAGLAAAIYLMVIPELDSKDRTYRGLRSKTSQLQGDIGRMQVEFDQFKDQQALFEKYKEDGFFIQQNRRQVEDILKTIQEKSGVNRASVAVNPASIENNDEAQKANHKILKSTIQVKVSALSDKDIFHYLHLVEKFFPGHITVESVEFERIGEINETVVLAIAGGQDVPLVDAQLLLTWRTMIPESQLIVGEGR